MELREVNAIEEKYVEIRVVGLSLTGQAPKGLKKIFVMPFHSEWQKFWPKTLSKIESQMPLSISKYRQQQMDVAVRSLDNSDGKKGINIWGQGDWDIYGSRLCSLDPLNNDCGHYVSIIAKSELVVHDLFTNTKKMAQRRVTTLGAAKKRLLISSKPLK